MKSNKNAARKGRHIGLTAAYAVVLAAVMVFFSACTSEDGGSADTNTMKETTTDRVPGGTSTQAVTDNVHDNQTTPGSGSETDSAPSGSGNGTSGETEPVGGSEAPGADQGSGNGSGAGKLMPRW